MNAIYGITVELDRTARASRVNRLRPSHSEPGQSRGRPRRAGEELPRQNGAGQTMLEVMDALSSQSDLVLLQYC